MWKNLYHQLNIFHKSLSVKDYCKAFLNIVNSDASLRSIIWVQEKLSLNDDLDLFPESKNLHNYINEGDYEFIVNYIFHFPATDKDWFDTDDRLQHLPEEAQYQRIFNDDSDVFIFKKAIFMPEYLLSKNDLNRQLTFLFLFFLPTMENYGMLYHHIKKIPLLCCDRITNDNFDMLLRLMQEYDSFGIDMLSEDRNLNHLLVEDFMECSANLYAFDSNTKWDEVLPIHKIHTLLDMNCNFNLFEEKMSKKFQYTFEEMPQILTSIERKYSYFKLTQQLKEKEYFKENILKV